MSKYHPINQISRYSEFYVLRCALIVSQIIKDFAGDDNQIPAFNLDKHKAQFINNMDRRFAHWDGPEVKRLQYCKSKGKGEKAKLRTAKRKKRNTLNTSRLTVVLNEKEFFNKCKESIDQWSREYEAIFFADCLEDIFEVN